MMHWYDGGTHMIWMWIGWLLAAVVVVWGIKALVSAAGGGGEGRSPEQILKERFARGEIDEATYERMLEELRK